MDLAIGADHKTEFEEHLKALPDNPLGKMEFSVQVLTTGYWPTYKDLSVIRLPPLLAKVSCCFFHTYYSLGDGADEDCLKSPINVLILFRQRRSSMITISIQPPSASWFGAILLEVLRSGEHSIIGPMIYRLQRFRPVPSCSFQRNQALYLLQKSARY